MAEEQKPQPQKPAQPQGSLADPKTKEILIVDDDEGVLNLLEVLVKRDGFQIDLARTAEEAIEKLKRWHDAVILDLMLPNGKTGLDVLEKLTSLQGRIPPVVVVTAYTGSKEAQAVMANPFVAMLLPKPINQKLLLGKLHELLKTQPKP
jgi:CheY-like chemotaxis protein